MPELSVIFHRITVTNCNEQVECSRCIYVRITCTTAAAAARVRVADQRVDSETAEPTRRHLTAAGSPDNSASVKL